MIIYSAYKYSLYKMMRIYYFNDHREKETYQKWFIFKSHRIKKIVYI